MVSIAPQASGAALTSDDPSWLGSAHGLDATNTITIDVSTLDTFVVDGVIPSGVVVARRAADGLYGPYGSAPLDTAAGFLAAPVPVPADATRVSGAVLQHGQVIEANLPFPTQVDSGARTDLGGTILFRAE